MQVVAAPLPFVCNRVFCITAKSSACFHAKNCFLRKNACRRPFFLLCCKKILFWEVPPWAAKKESSLLPSFPKSRGGHWQKSGASPGRSARSPASPNIRRHIAAADKNSSAILIFRRTVFYFATFAALYFPGPSLAISFALGHNKK